MEAWNADQATVLPFPNESFSSSQQACSNHLFSFSWAPTSCPSFFAAGFDISGTDTFVVFRATAGTVVKLSAKWWSFLVSAKGSLISFCLFPKLDEVGNWNRLMPVPWNEPLAVVLEGIWSKLSSALSVKSPCRSWAGTTAPLSLKTPQTAVPSRFSSWKTLS